MQRRRGCGAELTAHLAAFGAILRTLLSHYAPEISPLLLLAMDRLWLEALIMAANAPLSLQGPAFAGPFRLRARCSLSSAGVWHLVPVLMPHLAPVAM